MRAVTAFGGHRPASGRGARNVDVVPFFVANSPLLRLRSTTSIAGMAQSRAAPRRLRTLPIVVSHESKYSHARSVAMVGAAPRLKSSSKRPASRWLDYSYDPDDDVVARSTRDTANR